MTSKDLFKAAWSSVRFHASRTLTFQSSTYICFEIAMTYTQPSIKRSEEIYLRNLIPKAMLLLEKRNQPQLGHIRPRTKLDRHFALLRSRNQRYSKGTWRFKFWARNLKL